MRLLKGILIFISSLIACSFICVYIGARFEQLQNAIFKKPDDILFVHSEITNAIVTIGLFLCIITFWLVHIYGRKGSIKKYLVVLTLLVVTFVFAFIDMFSYSRIANESIFIRKNIIQNVKKYNWNEVNYISINYSYGIDKYRKKYVIFNYDLILKDGNLISFRNSEQFRSYTKVHSVTEFLKAKKVNIRKTSINSDDFNLLVKRYKLEYGQFTEKMFVELYNVTG